MAKWTVPGVAALARAALFFALWVLLVDAVDEPDLITGGVCAVLTSALVTVVQSLRSVRVRPTLPMLKFAYRPFWLLLTDSVRITWCLLAYLILRRPIQSGFRAERYRATGDDPHHVARRLLTEWAASLAPNRFAIGIDREREALIVHELTPAPGPLDPLELG
jgi:multisubunit Na+/H+ antiporter MnhE subunit